MTPGQVPSAGHSYGTERDFFRAVKQENHMRVTKGQLRSIIRETMEEMAKRPPMGQATTQEPSDMYPEDGERLAPGTRVMINVGRSLGEPSLEGVMIPGEVVEDFMVGAVVKPKVEALMAAIRRLSGDQSPFGTEGAVSSGLISIV